MMIFPFYHNLFWELFSLLSLTMLGLFYIIDRISVEKYPMSRLISLLLIVSATAVLWVRLKLVSTPYQIEGFVDLILLGAVLCIALNFIALILRASSINFSKSLERWFLWIIVIAVASYGIYLYIFGVSGQFVKLDMIVNYWIRPAWILVILTFFVQLRERP